MIVLGFDGMDPRIVEGMLAAGQLPNLAALRSRGAYSRLATTAPAQTPVAWSSFATGVNPGGHGVFDFIRRDPERLVPDMALNTYARRALLPPRAVNLRRPVPIWERLSNVGVESAVLRCPCTYPPDRFGGRLLAGVGVPDLRGGFGTATYFSAEPDVRDGESERLVRVPAGQRSIRVALYGPRTASEDLQVELQVDVDPAARRATLRSPGIPERIELRVGAWSEWLRLRFQAGWLQSVSGIARFRLVSLDPFALYASPVNFDPRAPMFPISEPPGYATELADHLGDYYTAGMAEDHGGLSNGRIGEAAFLEQCTELMREREAMLQLELDRLEEGLVYCLFDTPDRLAHMFWRFREPDHPANADDDVESDEFRHWRGAIERHYRECDQIVGRVAEQLSPESLLLVLSDHGMTSFRRGLDLNGWLADQGLLELEQGAAEVGQMFRGIDWSRTRAYALGLGGIYVNRAGREAQGIVEDAEVDEVCGRIRAGLGGLIDPEHGVVAVRSVATRGDLYRGPYAEESPDLQVLFAHGYRVSWATPLGGGRPGRCFEDNTRKWAGDHTVDPALVPGVLFASRPLAGPAPSLIDLAPTLLDVFGAPASGELEGRSLL